MRIFIDDSGDTGFKLDRGSTRFFVISLIIFEDDKDVERTAKKIKTLRDELGFPDMYEFKFQKCRRVVCEKFLSAINDCDFRVRSLVVDKTLIYGNELKNDKSSFYGFVIKTALEYNKEVIVNAKIRIDGSGDRVFKKKFHSYITRELDKNIVKDCKFLDSKNNVLIQLADMIVGSIRRSYDSEKTDRIVYRNIIKKHIDDETLLR